MNTITYQPLLAEARTQHPSLFFQFLLNSTLFFVLNIKEENQLSNNLVRLRFLTLSMPTFITLLFCLCAGIHALDLTFQLENTGVAFLDPSYSPNPERPASAAITLDRARTDVRIVEDDVTFRCGGLGDGAPEAPIFPEFVRE